MPWLTDIRMVNPKYNLILCGSVSSFSVITLNSFTFPYSDHLSKLMPSFTINREVAAKLQSYILLIPAFLHRLSIYFSVQ